MGRKRKNNEGSFYTTCIKGIVYQVYEFPFDASGKRKKVYGKTYAELMEKVDKKRQEQLLGTPRVNSMLTVAELVHYWLTYVCTVSPKTKEHYYGILESRIEAWSKFDIAKVPIAEVTESMVEKYLFSLCSHYAKHSIDRTWSVLQQSLQYAVDEGYLGKCDFKKIRIPKEEDVKNKKKENIVLEKADMDRLYQECMKRNAKGEFYYGVSAQILALIINTGLRVTEAVSLRWKDIASDFSSLSVRTVFVLVSNRNEKGERVSGSVLLEKPPKTKSSIRTLPLPKLASELLRNLKDIPRYRNEPSADDFVFETRGGVPVMRGNVEKTCKTIVRNLCLPDGITPHTLRHAYGSVLISEGTDIKVVSKLLGHTSVSFTYDVYINVLRQDEIKAMEALDKLFQSKSETPSSVEATDSAGFIEETVEEYNFHNPMIKSILESNMSVEEKERVLTALFQK